MPDATNTYETMASDALERMARLLGIAIDFDDPEPAVIAAVERKVAELVGRGDSLGLCVEGDSRCRK